MNDDLMDKVELFYESSYRTEGINAQRQWPNEELCRFMGRNYFHLEKSKRKDISILEVGCDSGCNLKMLVKEGFDVYGVDLSKEAIDLLPFIVDDADYNHFLVGDMTKMPFESECFNCVIDVFSSFCLNELQYEEYIKECYRTLKKNGKIFSYVPSKKSDAFINYEPASKLDASTLDGIHRTTSPYYGNFYPFRFMSRDDVKRVCGDLFEITYMENIGRTYNGGREYFAFLVFELVKR